MSNATRWYTSREAVKAAVGISGSELNGLIAGYIEAGSEDIERALGRRFIPETATKLFRWPQRIGSALTLTFPDEDLIAVTALLAAAQDSSPTTIVAGDYFLEPVNGGPPYTRIEIDLSSSAAFASGDTPQRSISVAGRWGFGEDTKAAGAVSGNGMNDATTTTLITDDASLIDVGDTLLLQSEQVFVTERTNKDSSANLNGDLTATKSEVSVTITDGTQVKQNEVIQLDSEKMLVESISSNVLTVQRAYDGSVLAAHTGAVDVYRFNQFTVVRGVNGTTAAAQPDTTAVAVFAPPADIVEYVRAYAIGHHQQGRSGWTGMVGGDQGSIETKMFGLWSMRQALIEKYRKVSL